MDNSSAVAQKKKAGILVSGLVDHEMVAGGRFELTIFGLCDLTQFSGECGWLNQVNHGLGVGVIPEFRPNRNSPTNTF